MSGVPGGATGAEISLGKSQGVSCSGCPGTKAKAEETERVLGLYV